MKRRDFVSRVTLGGAAAACTGLGTRAQAAAPAGHLNVRFLGMMTFVERQDRSFLAATPGHQAFHHMSHTPFLMARAGSRIAQAFGMIPIAGVVPEAFDSTLTGTDPAAFVYRSLDNTTLDINVGNADAVENNASEMALFNQIAPGKRVRGNLEKWASSTVSLRGGRLDNSAGHPDAGKLWSFGSYRQRLTDAVNFTNRGAATIIRLTSATESKTFTTAASQGSELWVISAAEPNGGIGEPTMLEHSEVLFDYLVDAKPVLATCSEATGRKVPDTVLPFLHPTSASNGIIASEAMMPPLTEFCFIAAILLGSDAK
jgi:hypothetical protein